MILTGGTVVSSLDPVQIARHDVHVANGRVAADGGAERRDCSGCLVVPGNVCAHTHLYSALARGMPYDLAPPENFLQILQRIWWRLDRALDEESVRASALVGGMEALLSGTTTLVDHHASPNAIDGSLDVIEDALRSLGIRSVLCYETSDRDGPERAQAGVAENRRFIERVLREKPPLVRGLVGAHASFTLSDETLAACAEAAHDCPGTALAMLYSPTEAKMVGRLTARCRVWWLGEPTAEQRAQIEQRQPLQDAALKEDSALCE